MIIDHGFDSSGASRFDLTSLPPSSAGEFCPGPVSLTCEGVGVLPTLFWLANSTEKVLARYAVILEDNFPVLLDVSPALPGVTAEVTSASRNRNDPNTFDVTSSIHANNVSVLNRWSFKCADTNRNGSRPLTIRVNSLSTYMLCCVVREKVYQGWVGDKCPVYFWAKAHYVFSEAYSAMLS